jgi:hypothetical protein
MRFTLRNDGYAGFKKIMQGKKWVGRVVTHAEGGYLGIIGKNTARGATEVEAFREVAAKAFGCSSAAEVEARNREIRAARKHTRAIAQHAVDQFLNKGNWDPMWKLLSQENK